jgi:hypothetical protein
MMPQKLSASLVEVAYRREGPMGDLSYNATLHSPGVSESILDQLDWHDT